MCLAVLNAGYPQREFVVLETWGDNALFPLAFPLCMLMDLNDAVMSLMPAMDILDRDPLWDRKEEVDQEPRASLLS